ncbi:hypothetical protein CASFOL_036120 [Castilleja foliolosa]|uniref:MADS-box domain-containing protein n=1 Tax=Castilleja foliolosa TaxID=1961234 RepID=A0ABD3BUN0_9LAMI
MGRAKLNMELIAKEKKRLTTFKKRKQGLIRKIHEFTTLCDVSACMIIYGPNQESGRAEPETWPENIDEVKRIIDIRAKNRDLGDRTYGLSDFFLDRKRKVEDELKKMKKKNMEAKYPTWLEFMNYLSEAQMRDFAADLIAKAERVRARIEQMRCIEQGNQQSITTDMGFVGGDYYNNAPHQIQMANYYPTVDNSTMRHLMNGEYIDFNNNGFGNLMCGPSMYDQSCVFSNDQANDGLLQMPIMQYYGPGQLPIMPYGPGPEMPFFKMENNDVNSVQCDQLDYNDNK